MATPHANLPRGTRIRVGVTGTLKQILFGPAELDDGSQNLVGALATCMGNVGARNIREFQETEIIIAPAIKTEGQSLPDRAGRRHGQQVTEQIIILDFGSQYTQVIARRIRECQVFSQILRFDTSAAKLAALKPSGLILSGGPASVYGKRRAALRSRPSGTSAFRCSAFATECS